MTVALRTSLIWNDEVMDDVVIERPAPVTLGASGDTTFVLPAIGLPDHFAIVRPGARGHVLTLGAHMRGTLSLGGVVQDVASLVAADAEPFHAITLGVADWGVIELDDSGQYKLFFQFVPLEDHAWHIPKPVIAAGAIGYALASCVMTAAFAWWKDLDLGEAAFRGAGLVTLSLAAAAVLRLVWKQDSESRASLAFSVALHAVLLFVTFQIYARTSSAATWPGPREPSANYLVPRIDQAPMSFAPTLQTAPAPSSPTVTATNTPPAPDPLPPPPSTLRHRDRPIEPPQRAAVAPPPPAGPGVLRYTDVLGEVAGRNVDGTTGRIGKVGPGKPGKGPPGPPSNGLGPTRQGSGGPPGPPTPETPLDVGPMRPATFCMGEGCGGGHGPQFELPPKPPEDEGPRLTADEIDQKVRSKRGIFRMCYQVELNKKPQLAGSVVVHFKIAADGHVSNASVVDGNLTDPNVTSCILRNVNALRFPAKGGAGVTYPFVFSPGG